MSDVNFHQYFSEELKEFHSILIHQQDMYAKQIKACKNDASHDETTILVKLKQSTDLAQQYFRGFSDLLAEGKIQKIKMNIQFILSSIRSYQNTYLQDYQIVFNIALERIEELELIIDPTITNQDGQVIITDNIIHPYTNEEEKIRDLTLKSAYYILGGLILITSILAIVLLSSSNVPVIVITCLILFMVLGTAYYFKNISTWLITKYWLKELSPSHKEWLQIKIDPRTMYRKPFSNNKNRYN